jgi:hypothetical protein
MLSSYYPSYTCSLCPFGIIDKDGKIFKLLDVRLPKNQKNRMPVILRVLNYMKDLRRWFTLTNNHLLQFRMAEYMEDLPFNAFKDIDIVDLSVLDMTQINDGYEVFVGEENNHFDLTVSSEEFSIKASMLMMIE